MENASSDQAISLPRNQGTTWMREPYDYAPPPPAHLRRQQIQDPTQAKPRSVDEFTTRASLAVVFSDLTSEEIEAAAQLREKKNPYRVGKIKLSTVQNYDQTQEESRVYDRRDMAQQHALAAEHRKIEDPEETDNSEGPSCDNEYKYTW